jgi:hypothetical protein
VVVVVEPIVVYKILKLNEVKMVDPVVVVATILMPVRDTMVTVVQPYRPVRVLRVVIRVQTQEVVEVVVPVEWVFSALMVTVV